LDRPQLETSPTNRDPSRPDLREARRPYIYARPEAGPTTYLWLETGDSPPDAPTESKKVRLRSERDWTGPGAFEASPSACQILWGAEPLSAGPERASSPWIDAATAAAVVCEELRRAIDPASSRPIEIVVIGALGVETHTFRLARDEGWLRGVAREELRVQAIDPEDPSAWDRIDIEGNRTVEDRFIVAAPSLGDDRWLDVTRRAGDIPGFAPEPLYLAFAKARLRHGGFGRPVPAFDYRFSYRRARWGSSVPHRDTIRSVAANLHRVYRLAGGHFDEDSVAFRVDRRLSVGSANRQLIIPWNRFAGHRDRIRSLELDACPLTGGLRFVFRSDPEGPSPASHQATVLWPVSAPATSVEALGTASPGPVGVSICLAVDPRKAARTWADVAPLADRLRERGRLARLQVVWSHPDRPHQTQGWSPQQLATRGEPFRIEPPGADSPDAITCRGLSQALREALLLEGAAEGTGRPAVGLIIVDRDYDPGRDPAFQTIGSRWAWFVRMRRILGGPLALLAYQLEGPASQPDLGFRAVLGHLVILGRQASTTRAPVATLEERQLDDPDATDVEVEAILSVADRMERLARPEHDGEPEPTPAGPLYVIGFEDRQAARRSPDIDGFDRGGAGTEADPSLGNKRESS
jgi:hypothetical protein